MRNLLGISIIIIIIQPSVVFGQWYDRIQTESDWESFYRDGYYDYNTYQIYREISEGNITDTVEYIISSMGTSPGEITNRLLEKESGRSITRLEERRHYIPDRVKFGRKVYNNDSRSYLSLDKRWGDFSTRFKFEDNDGEWRAGYRKIDYINDNLNLVLGNYSVRIGCGVGIGRFDYRPVSFEPDYDSGEDILYPDNSFYNGAKMEYKRISIIYSAKKYHDISKRIIGGYWERDLGEGSVGFTSAATVLSSGAGKRTLGSGSVFGEMNGGRLAAEVAYSESGLGYCIRAKGNSNIVIKAWHYDYSFVNLQSSGYAHTDYESFKDDRFELSFRQPQKGETGLFTNFKTSALTGTISGSSEIWKKSPGSKVAMLNSIYGLWDLLPELSLNAGLSQRNGYQRDRLIAELESIFHKKSRIGARGFLWIENKNIEKEKSKYYIFAFVPVGDYLILSGRFRWNLSGKFDYFIEQRSVLAGGFTLTATYKWNQDQNVDLGPFYLTLEKSWKKL